MSSHLRFEISDGRDVLSQPYQRIGSILDRFESCRFQGPNVLLCELLVSDVLERPATPQLECIVQQLDRSPGVGLQGRSAAFCQLAETVHVQADGLSRKHV